MRKPSLSHWCIALISGGFVPAFTVLAQEAVHLPGIPAETERVVVTGSYIPIPTAESEGPLPVTTYAQEQMKDFGANAPAEALRRLPSAIGTTENENNSARGTGAAMINLRAYGSKNTLTMINGRRAFSFEDVNALPLGFIESVEILKDGASAIYGTDAVAGVANFKLRHAFKGGEIDLVYGNTNLGVANDAAVRTAYAVGGLVGEKYNFTAGASYYDRAAIFARDTFLSSLTDRRRLMGSNLGSPQFSGRISLGNPRQDLILIDPANVPDGREDYRQYIQAEDAFNYRRFTPSIPAQDRLGLFLDGEYKLLPQDTLTFFATILYANTRQYNGFGPSLFTLPGNIAANSPYNPVRGISQPLTAVSYASLEVGNRESTYDNDFFHLIAGLRGQFAKDYFWEVGYVFDEQDLERTDTGDQRRSLVEAAVLNGSFNPFVGLNAPRQGTSNGFTYNNPAALRAATYEAVSTTEIQNQLLDGKIGGRVLTDLPQGGINFVVGFDLRHQDLSKNADPILVAGDGLGSSADTTFEAEQDVAAGYLELNIPFVISTMKVPLVHNLDFTFAWRYERFEINGIDPADEVTATTRTLETDVPKFALRWAPWKDLTLRASYSRSFATPSLFEFFEPHTQNFTQFPLILDPLDPITPGGFVRPPGGTIVGGSVHLEPERTDNYSAGFVLTPRFVPNLTLTADYYQLNSEGVVVSGFAQAAVVRNALNGSFADSIIRLPNGALFQVIDLPFNAARKAVEGIDVTGVYEIPTEHFGKFTITAAYNHLFRFNVQITPDAGFTNYLGRFQSSNLPISPGSLPYNKGYLQVQWEHKGFQFINTFNYVGDYKDFGGFLNNSRLVITDPANPEFTRERDVKAYLTFDTQLSYTYTAPRVEVDAKSAKAIRESLPTIHAWQRCLDRTTIRIGMNNIFDEPPPFNAGAPTGDNYDTSLATLRGRYYYIGLNKKF